MATVFVSPLQSLIVTSPYGDRVHPVTGVPTRHEGVDFKTRHIQRNGHAEVFAPEAGMVQAGVDNVSGKYVLLTSRDGGRRWLFAHLSQSLWMPGVRSVVEGDVIGIAGSTGRVTGPHLHVGLQVVRSDGQRVSVDPMILLGARFPVTIEEDGDAVGGGLFPLVAMVVALVAVVAVA